MGVQGESPPECQEFLRRLPNDLIFMSTIPPELSLEFRSIVPGLINVRSDIPISEMICNSKFGYSNYVLVPITCVETGMCQMVELLPKTTILVDRPLSPYTWVRQGDNVGFIKDIQSKVDLEINETDLVITNVPETDITALPEFYKGQYIFYKTWIGCIEAVTHKIHLRFDKGHECWIYDNQEGAQAHRQLHLKYPGESISLSGSDVRDAKWIKYPNLWDWFLLRYFNLSYHKRSYGKIIKNMACAITVSWPNIESEPGTDASKFSQPPPREISGKDLASVQVLELPDKNYLWYGMKCQYKVKSLDRIIDIYSDWKKDLLQLQEQGLTSQEKPNFAGGDASWPNSDPIPPIKTRKVLPGTEIIGKVILRRATATVVWQDGITSDVSVRNLVPYYCQPNQPLPINPGAVVRNRESPRRDDANLKYGVIRSCDPISGTANVKWLESQAPQGKLSFHFTKIWNTKEDLDHLEERSEFKFPVGLIVISKVTGNPGVVIGSDMERHILVKFGREIKQVTPYMLEKFKHVAFSSVSGGLQWYPLREHSKINQKHINANPWSNNFGNVIPPASTFHGDLCEMDSFSFKFRGMAPLTHMFITTKSPTLRQMQSFGVEWNTHALEGMWIRSFGDRPDLLSVLMRGGEKTPFEFGLYSFDIYLPRNYPAVPPSICYIKADPPGCITDLGFPEDGIVNIDDFLEGEVKNKDYRLPNVLKTIQETLFAVGVETLHLCDSETQGGLGLFSFLSYTKDFSMAMKNQELLRNVIKSIAHLLIAPPSLWEDIIWEYYKLQVPRLIARVRKWMHGSSMLLDVDSVSPAEAETELTEGEKPGYLLLPFDPTLQLEISQSVANLALTYSKVY